MTKLLLAALLITSSFMTKATDFSVTGARYTAQGNAMTANASDAFAIAVNPANLLSHGMDPLSEFAININSYPTIDHDTYSEDYNDVVQETEFQYIGGYWSKDSIVLGGYINSNSIPIEATFRDGKTLQNLDVNQWGIAFAMGSVRETDQDTFDWGIGGSLDLFEAENSDEHKIAINSYEYTLSGKLRKQSTFAFDHNTLDFITNLGVSYSSETACDVEQYNNCILRPEISRVGLSTLLAHSGKSLSWDLTLTGEYVNQSSPDFADDYIQVSSYDNEVRLGTEFMLMEPFGYKIDIAFRTGAVKKDDQNKSTFKSYGIGMSYKRYSCDLSYQESSQYVGEYNYNFSFIYQL